MGGWVYIEQAKRHAVYRRDGQFAGPDDPASLGQPAGFAARYGVLRLVHAEHFERIDEAIAREKAINKWRRAWKLELVEKGNPEWNDLFEHILGA